jgi:hypothetical protein
MKKAVLLLWIGASAFAQDPAIEWQKTYGGNQADILNTFEPTPDGGFIAGGYTTSGATGEKTEASNGGLDIWIVKLDGSGAIQWQNSIGGSGDDYVNVVKPTNDGGYIVLAGSDSNISGDKTENSRGGLDYWILKLDASGNIVWQKTYGGSSPDFDAYGQQTADNGYIVAGYSDSGATGDKTEASNGQRDFWVLKLDPTGDITWQNAMGGSLIDRVQAALQTTDGGFIVGGFSTSPLSGDKTEANYGGTDYWIVKLDASGNITWQNTVGGNASDAFRDLTIATDGGYLLGGYSLSGISGEKTEDSNGDYDYWVVKLDSNGAVQWQNTIGGAGTDYLRDLKPNADGGYLVAGYSDSGATGDKTEASNGGYDYWLVSLDASGNIAAQNSIGGSADESAPYILSVAGGGYVMACASASGVSGDKSEASRGSEDYWIFKVSEAILSGTNHASHTFTIAPNPTDGNLQIDFGQHHESGEISIATLSGQVIFRKKTNGVQSQQIEFDASAGIYIVTIAADGMLSRAKVVKM